MHADSDHPTRRHTSVPVLQRGPLDPGQGQTPVRLPPGPALDVLGWVTTAHQQAAAAEATLAAAVTRARQAGTSWTVIGAQLGISRQGAQQRFTRASIRKADQRQQS